MSILKRLINKVKIASDKPETKQKTRTLIEKFGTTPQKGSVSTRQKRQKTAKLKKMAYVFKNN